MVLKDDEFFYSAQCRAALIPLWTDGGGVEGEGGVYGETGPPSSRCANLLLIICNPKRGVHSIYVHRTGAGTLQIFGVV